MKRSKRKALPKNKIGRILEKLEHLKASVRAKIEHPFHVIKKLYGHRKTRYRGLAKNTAQLFRRTPVALDHFVGAPFISCSKSTKRLITQSCYHTNDLVRPYSRIPRDIHRVSMQLAFMVKSRQQPERGHCIRDVPFD
jgi:hypothetical protein